MERGSVILSDFSFLSCWREELQETNCNNKEGMRFVYMNSYIEFLSYIKVGLDIPYRTVQRIKSLPEYLTLNQYMRYASHT
ncbi:MAG: hypothetical protein QXY74_08420 [Candidatus Bathyarchaeia archaeon]